MTRLDDEYQAILRQFGWLMISMHPISIAIVLVGNITGDFVGLYPISDFALRFLWIVIAMVILGSILLYLFDPRIRDPYSVEGVP